jgi:glycosyltransferase involved in cell wall biosynthesis
MKKILQVVRPAQGGIKKHLATLLAGLDRTKYELYLAAPPDPDLVEALRPLVHDVYYVPIAEGLNPRRDWQIIKTLRGIITSQQIDLVHTHGVRAGILGQYAAYRAGRCPVVATIHNSQDPHSRLFQVFRFLQTYLNRAAVDHIITVSQALKEEIIKFESTPSEKITVVYNGIDLGQYHPSHELDPEVRVAGLPDSLPVIGAVARLEPHKGLKTLVEAVPLIEKDFGPVSLAIIGDGPERPLMERLIRQLGLSGRVVLAGFRNDVPELLPGFDLVAIPSLQEGLSILAIEALACGCPVVASRVGGLPEIIRDGHTGLLVPPCDPPALAEAIIRVLNNRQLAAQLGKAGRRLVENQFTRARMIAGTEEIYDQVLRLHTPHREETER